MRTLVVVDDCTRERLALVPDTSISSSVGASELDGLLVAYGKSNTIVSDNGKNGWERRNGQRRTKEAPENYLARARVF